MAILGKTLKQHNWIIQADGVNLAGIQSVETPEVEKEEILYSIGKRDVKEEGRIKTGDMVLNGLMFTGNSSSDNLWSWFQEGYTDVPSLGLKRTFRLIQNDDNGIPKEIWEARNCWVKKNSLGTLDKKTSDNVMTTITLSVEEWVPIELGV